MSFVELDLIYCGRRIHHKIYAGAIFGEGDNVADVVNAFQNHEDAVEARGAAGVRGGAKFEGVQHAAKARFYVGVVEAEDVKNFVHDVWVVIADSTRGDFVAIHHHIVLVSDDGEFVGVCFGGFECGKTAFWHGEGVVAEI